MLHLTYKNHKIPITKYRNIVKRRLIEYILVRYYVQKRSFPARKTLKPSIEYRYNDNIPGIFWYI